MRGEVEATRHWTTGSVLSRWRRRRQEREGERESEERGGPANKERRAGVTAGVDGSECAQNRRALDSGLFEGHKEVRVEGEGRNGRQCTRQDGCFRKGRPARRNERARAA